MGIEEGDDGVDLELGKGVELDELGRLSEGLSLKLGAEHGALGDVRLEAEHHEDAGRQHHKHKLHGDVTIGETKKGRKMCQERGTGLAKQGG